MGHGAQRLDIWPMVLDYIERLPAELGGDVLESLEYLRDFGRAAALPDVRHRIAGHPDLAETRNQATIAGRRYTIRCLVVFHTDHHLLACVIGDKDRHDDDRADWYETWVPVAQAIYDHWKEQP